METTEDKKIFVIDSMPPSSLPKTSSTQKIYIPFYCYCYQIPKEKTVDIIENLILSLAQLKSADEFSLSDNPIDKLKKIGFPEELVKSAGKMLEDEGLIDEHGKIKNYKNLKNTQSEFLEEISRVIVFKDASSNDGEIIPHFILEDVFRDFKKSRKTIKGIIKDEKNFVVSEIKGNEKISIAELATAIKIFNRKQRELGVEIPVDDDEKENDEYEFADDEVSWQSFDIDSKKKNPDNYKKIKNLYSIKPDKSKLVETIYFPANIYVDFDCPDRVYMKSPFDESLNPMFDRIFLRLQKDNNELKNFSDEFFTTAKSNAKERYAFNNDLNIEIFNIYPVILNEEKYSELKKEIESLKRAENRILIKHEKDYDTLYVRCNRVMECFCKIIVQKISSAEKQNIIENIHSADFRYQVKTLIDEFNLRDCEKYQNLSHEKLKEVLNGRNFYAKSGMLLLLFDAYFNQRISTAFLFRDDPLILKNVAYLVDIRNNYGGHHTINQQDEKSEKILAEEVIKISAQVIRSIIGNCIINWR